MTIFTVLQTDHARLLSLLQKLMTTMTRSGKRRVQLLAQLRRALEVHSRGEATVFYGALSDFDQTRRLVIQAREEHLLIESLIDQLEGTPPADETWSSKLAILKENVELHLRAEERDLFHAAHEVLNRAQAEMLGDQMRKEMRTLARSVVRTS